jgi:hypothetical protein
VFGLILDFEIFCVVIFEDYYFAKVTKASFGFYNLITGKSLILAKIQLCISFCDMLLKVIKHL